MTYQREKDLLKLEAAFFENLERNDYCEYGGIGLDDKRPFGNSDVPGDILKIIGQEKEGDDGDEACWSSFQRTYANKLYDSLVDHLKSRYKQWVNLEKKSAK